MYNKTISTVIDIEYLSHYFNLTSTNVRLNTDMRTVGFPFS